MANRAAKGSSFERWIATQLSLWWTNGDRTDVFWRTSNSGGRATVRGRSKKSTKNQHGDICAIDPIGQPLLDLVTIEVKRGFSKYSIADLLDKPEWAAPQIYEQWVDQAMTSHEQAGSFSWLLMVRRDKRIPLVFSSWELHRDLCDAGCDFRPPVAWLSLSCGEIFCVTLMHFLKLVKPEHIRQLVKEV